MSWALEIAGTVYDHCKPMMPLRNRNGMIAAFEFKVPSEVSWIMLQSTVYMYAFTFYIHG